MTIKGISIQDLVTPSQLRTLAAVMGGAHGIKPVARSLGNNVNHARTSLQALRRKGLVAFEDYLGGTLRPLVRFIPAEEL